jgi:hypothetical protein
MNSAISSRSGGIRGVVMALSVVLATACDGSDGKAAVQRPGTLSLTAPLIGALAPEGKVQISVEREYGGAGAVTVDFATRDRTALAGSDYTAVHGTLSWPDGDTAPKTIAVPVSNTGAAGGRSFQVVLAMPKGGAGLGVDHATVVVERGGTLAVHVRGKSLVDAEGAPLQLRGVNVSGLENTAIQGWAWVDGKKGGRYDYWGDAHLGVEPDWKMIHRWPDADGKVAPVNAVRLPLNEASWLGLTTYDHDCRPRQADPGLGSSSGVTYRDAVKRSVADAVAAGMYVILDLHWNGPDVTVPGPAAPGASCPKSPVPQTPFEDYGAQNPMADADHSYAFWTSVANTFKDNPAVMFELFNEPYLNQSWMPNGTDFWAAWRDGGTEHRYRDGIQRGDDSKLPQSTWRTAGMQALIDAVRATGATNVVLIGGLGWSADLSGWLKYQPKDPLQQMAAVWHAYPCSGNPWCDKPPTKPLYGDDSWGPVAAIAEQLPVVITELGDHNADGTAGAPFASKVLPWADARGISYLGWAFDVYNGTDNDLIKDDKGTPTDGYGRYFHAHLACVASGRRDCP